MPDEIHHLEQRCGLSEEEIARLSQPQSEHVLRPFPQYRRVTLSSQRRLATKPGLRGRKMSAAAHIPHYLSAAGSQQRLLQERERGRLFSRNGNRRSQDIALSACGTLSEKALCVQQGIARASQKAVECEGAGVGQLGEHRPLPCIRKDAVDQLHTAERHEFLR